MDNKMNIHINKEEYEKLLETVIVKVTVGSHLYGLNNDNSDTDILYICGNFKDNSHSLVKMHHQFQYKDIENNTDHLFIDLQTFVNNLLKGDSTINFEAIFSDEIKNSDLRFLYSMRFMFYNYQLIRAYLGFAKRDVKIYRKDRNSKKMFHAKRGYDTAEILFTKQEYSNDLANNRLLYRLKNGLEDITPISVNSLDTNIADLRTKLNQRLEKKEIERIVNGSDLQKLDALVIDVSKKYSFEGRFINNDYYESYQADVEYKKD